MLLVDFNTSGTWPLSCGLSFLKSSTIVTWIRDYLMLRSGINTSPTVSSTKVRTVQGVERANRTEPWKPGTRPVPPVFIWHWPSSMTVRISIRPFQAFSPSPQLELKSATNETWNQTQDSLNPGQPARENRPVFNMEQTNEACLILHPSQIIRRLIFLSQVWPFILFKKFV